jgi:REP element-mobilizing transposase RayT
MFDNHVKPGEAVWLSEEDEIIIAEIIADIVKEDKLNILEYNICGDHMHILLVCDENELPKIIGKIKAMTARACNIATGRTIPGDGSATRGHVPLSSAVSSSSVSPDMSEEVEEVEETRGHVPLSGSDTETLVDDEASTGNDIPTNTKKEKKKYNSLWTQKFGKRKITGDNDLQNVINYIHTNRQKHELPENKKLEKIIGEMSCSVGHAFRTEYTGGFDVVIGNPPYGAKIAKNELTFMLSKQGKNGLSKVLSDTYIAFYIESLKILLKNGGLLGFITPNTWRLVQSGNEFLDFLSKRDYVFLEIIQHQEKVFSDATVDCDTVIIKKQKLNNHILRIAINNYYDSIYSHSISQNILAEQDFFNLFLTEKIYTLKQKIEEKSIFVKDCLIIKNGVKPYEKGKGKPSQTVTTMKEKPFTSEIKIDESFSPLIGGSSFHRYKLLWNNDYWIKYGEWLAAPRDKEIFAAPEKLIFRQTGDSIIGTFVGNKFVMRNNTHIILPENNDINLKYVLTVLNSRLSNFIYWTINPEKGEALAEVKAFHLGLLCFPKINTDAQQPFIEKADKMLSLNQDLQEKKTKFLNRIKDNLATTVATRGHVPLANVANVPLANVANVPLANAPIKISKKLEAFYNYDFKTFLTEIKKQKVTLSLSRQDEWEEYFTAYKNEINQLQDEIHTTDKGIDQMVYELYDLTEEEIKIVEESLY